MLHIDQKGIHKFCCDPPPQTPTPLTLGDCSIGQNSIFSEHGHVAYKVKGNHEI